MALGPAFRMPEKTRDRYYQVCECQCGDVGVYDYSNLRQGYSKSCGCLNIDNHTKRLTKHGKSKTPEYAVWNTMRARCNNENSTSAKDYQQRGIRVCPQWDHPQGFEQFISDMGPRPSPKHTIERKNNNGDYCPENCIWDTRENQVRNKRNNVWLEFQGKRQTLEEWARELGVRSSVLGRRVKRGWTVEAVLTTPVYVKGPRKKNK